VVQLIAKFYSKFSPWTKLSIRKNGTWIVQGGRCGRLDQLTCLVSVTVLICLHSLMRGTTWKCHNHGVMRSPNCALQLSHGVGVSLSVSMTSRGFEECLSYGISSTRCQWSRSCQGVARLIQLNIYHISIETTGSGCHSEKIKPIRYVRLCYLLSISTY